MNASLGWPSLSAAAAVLLFVTSGFGADSEAQILAPSGKLRAALYSGTPTSILDPKESHPRGVGYELGKHLAERLSNSFAWR